MQNTHICFQNTNPVFFAFPERYPIYPVHHNPIPEPTSQFWCFRNANAYIRDTQIQFQNTQSQFLRFQNSNPYSWCTQPQFQNTHHICYVSRTSINVFAYPEPPYMFHTPSHSLRTPISVFTFP